MGTHAQLRTVKQLVDETPPCITTGKVRSWIFNASSNGLTSALIKIGGRIYIDIDAFDTWLEDNRMGPANS